MPLGLLLGYLMENIPIGVALGRSWVLDWKYFGQQMGKEHGDPQQDEEQANTGKWQKKEPY
jgi:hypothetical protein